MDGEIILPQWPPTFQLAILVVATIIVGGLFVAAMIAFVSSIVMFLRALGTRVELGLAERALQRIGDIDDLIGAHKSAPNVARAVWARLPSPVDRILQSYILRFGSNLSDSELKKMIKELFTPERLREVIRTAPLRTKVDDIAIPALVAGSSGVILSAILGMIIAGSWHNYMV